MTELFPDAEPVSLEMPDAEVIYHPAFFSPAESEELYRRLTEEIDWRQEQLRMFGREIPFPRLTAWYGDKGKSYRYSGKTYQPQPWTELLRRIKKPVDAAAGVTFNSVLLNWYRDQSDSMSWHSDDEPELGENPVIGSVSFGVPRKFQFKHKTRKAERHSLPLEPGSLLIMAGPTQHHWLHAVPKTKKTTGGRINLTFRVIRN